MWEMNQQVAKQVLKGLRGKRESERHRRGDTLPLPAPARGRTAWLRSRSASASRAAGRTGSTTSPSSRAGARATPRTSTSPGRSTPSASTCPLMASAMDGVVSPATAIEIGRLGGVGVLNLEGLWTRYEDPEPLLRRDRRARRRQGHRRACRRSTPSRSSPSWSRPAHPRDQGRRRRRRARRSPRSAPTQFAKAILEAELDLLVIQGTVVSAEHVSKTVEPLNLKRFVRELDIPVIVGGCASYQAALHLMRTGAAGVLVGVGPGHACTTRGVLGIGVPQATAIADARAARMRHLDETGVYVHVIADGGMGTGGDIAKAIVCGADAVMIGSPLAAAAEAPGRGYHWGMATFHPTLPRGARVQTDARAARSRRSSSARPTRTTAA